ncbi:PadR family transcriptional regulator [Actinocorallia longicatena]|uniref:Transcription regulator PadR N-terminal domain-containing protein n=1 Tax=Actinocorallia longicatena TaxID=111803 RepID=A0ABP6QE43_9ACTN
MGRRHGWGHHGPPGPEFLFGFGGGRPPFGKFPFGPPPPKAKRGDVRTAILVLLAEGPRNGYQIIQEVEERSGGAWKPSPGAVYPALQQLADEGLILGDEADGRKTFSLTEAGRSYVAANPQTAPWADQEDTGGDWPGGDIAAVFKEAAQLGTALVQVVQAGSPEQVAEARKLVTATRKRLYGILAGDDEEEDA